MNMPSLQDSYFILAQEFNGQVHAVTVKPINDSSIPDPYTVKKVELDNLRHVKKFADAASAIEFLEELNANPAMRDYAVRDDANWEGLSPYYFTVQAQFVPSQPKLI
jgi:hypothetical protein